MKNHLTMRGQLGPCLVPGNAIAARRLARKKKPPPVILWSIGIITCILFIGAAALLAVGYLNPFGTVGLSILGVGAVVYFGAIIFLVLACLWVERKYPGIQPLSFKFYSRKPQRPPPTTAFVNPNLSGQTPQETPSYGIHNELPSNIARVTNEEISENVPADPMQNKNDTESGNNQPEQTSSLNNPATAQQDEGSEDVTKDPVLEDITIIEKRNQEEHTGATTSGNIAITNTSNAQNHNDHANANTAAQNEKMSKNNQPEYYLAKASSAQNKGKTQPKTQQLDLPAEDYHNPENSPPSSNNIKESGPETQATQPTQQSRNTPEINPSHNAIAPSIPTSQEEKATMHQQTETRIGDATTREQSAENQSPFVQQTQYNTSQTSNTETEGLFKKNQSAKDISQTDKNIQRRTAIRVNKQIKEPQSQNIQDISQVKKDLTPTPLLADDRKPNKQDTGLHSNSGKNIDSTVLTKTSNDKKRVQFQEYHAPSAQPSADANNALQYKDDGRHGHQNKSNDISASTKHLAQNPDFKGALPKLAKKMDTPKKPKVKSPERARKQESPKRARKPKSPERGRKPESPEKARKQESPERAWKPGPQERARKPGSPERARKPGSPERAWKPGPPERARKPGSPERARKPESPERARKQGSPERAWKPGFPERAWKPRSPERVGKPGSPERTRNPGSPERARKLESPERGRKLRIDNKLSHSPPNVRKIVSSSSPTRHHQNISPKAQRNKDNVIATSNLSSSKEVFYRRQNYYASLSSESSDLPKSTLSPPRHNKGSPDLSQRHQFHTSKSAELYSSARKERKPDNHSQQSSPASYSSDVTSSASSSPRRHRRKDPDDISHKAQNQKGNPSVNTVFPSNMKKEDLNKTLSQQSFQSDDVTLSPNMSSAKVLQYKLERVDLNNSTKYPLTVDPLIQSFGATSDHKQQTKHQHPDKPRTSSHSRDLSPTAARASAPSNKRFQANPRQDQA